MGKVKMRWGDAMSMGVFAIEGRDMDSVGICVREEAGSDSIARQVLRKLIIARHRKQSAIAQHIWSRGT